ncbi:MAG: nucleotidyltransferase domain-containing protein [Chloroflexi bacterium]|nr:nucleotidyltransferase domain-containing protein [Chloroflexota bacterium]MCI0574726.1 nucleotidyltransferase domain-containing protein [Chloroflexota bacterium]MCI0646303.1 nucleotidyltransferase domain-containing protein [Chloroflexota bacterium]MCI0730299.1 nucleotidyltransferase domain-containing protein [Chloroflexota bacterium]
MAEPKLKKDRLPLHLAENERSALVTLVARLQNWFGSDLLRVVLFGSKARGDFDNESDLDVLIVIRLSDNNYIRARQRIMDGTYDLELDYDVVFSFLIEDEQGYARMQQWNLLINRNIEQDGIVLWTSPQSEPSFA